jgi:hypothetical protein
MTFPFRSADKTTLIQGLSTSSIPPKRPSYGSETDAHFAI